MTTVTFDTLTYARKLKDGGFTQEQAEAQAEAQKAVLSEVLNTTLATKDDINRLEMVTRDDINRLEKEILVLKWMTGFMLAGVLSLIIKTFFT